MRITRNQVREAVTALGFDPEHVSMLRLHPDEALVTSRGGTWAVSITDTDTEDVVYTVPTPPYVVQWEGNRGGWRDVDLFMGLDQAKDAAQRVKLSQPERSVRVVRR